MMTSGHFAHAFCGLVRGSPLDAALFTLTMLFAVWGLMDLIRCAWQWLSRDREKNSGMR